MTHKVDFSWLKLINKKLILMLSSCCNNKNKIDKGNNSGSIP